MLLYTTGSRSPQLHLGSASAFPSHFEKSICISNYTLHNNYHKLCKLQEAANAPVLPLDTWLSGFYMEF